MPYWVAQCESKREATAAHFLALAGYTSYLPLIRVRREARPLFPCYLFIATQAGWWDARWSVGVVRLVGHGGSEPARVADRIIDELRKLERGGVVRLPEPPRLKPGDPVVIKRGVFTGQSALYAGQRPHERVAVLLRVLGRVELAAADIAPA